MLADSGTVPVLNQISSASAHHWHNNGMIQVFHYDKALVRFCLFKNLTYNLVSNLADHFITGTPMTQ